MVVGDGAPRWQNHVEGVVLASLTAEEGTGDDTHLYTELLESQAFSTSLSVLWTSAISGMFLIPQLYQDQPKLQPLELQLPDGR